MRRGQRESRSALTEKTMRANIGMRNAWPGSMNTLSSVSSFCVKSTSSAMSLNAAVSMPIMTYMAPCGSTTRRPGTPVMRSTVKAAFSSSWATVSVWNFSRAAASADPGSGARMAGSADWTMALAPRVSWESLKRPSRMAAKAPFLSCTSTHPTRQLRRWRAEADSREQAVRDRQGGRDLREGGGACGARAAQTAARRKRGAGQVALRDLRLAHPGTRNSLAMPPVERIGTVSVRSAMAWKVLPEKTMLP